jgi:hypothetical protein
MKKLAEKLRGLRERRGGFTLIETVVSIALIALICVLMASVFMTGIGLIGTARGKTSRVMKRGRSNGAGDGIGRDEHLRARGFRFGFVGQFYGRFRYGAGDGLRQLPHIHGRRREHKKLRPRELRRRHE